jgi:hypothetical protein
MTITATTSILCSSFRMFRMYRLVPSMLSVFQDHALGPVMAHANVIIRPSPKDSAGSWGTHYRYALAISSLTLTYLSCLSPFSSYQTRMPQANLPKMASASPAIVNTKQGLTSIDHSKGEKHETAHIEHHAGTKPGLGHENVGKAILEQKHVIPTTGERIPTSKWEYIFFCVFVSPLRRN